MTTPSTASSIRKSCCLLPGLSRPGGALWNSVEQLKRRATPNWRGIGGCTAHRVIQRGTGTDCSSAYCSSQFVQRNVRTSTFTTQAAAIRTPIFFSPCAQWTNRAVASESKRICAGRKRQRESGFHGNFKTRFERRPGWNSQENAEVWRKAWADLANEFLNGITARSASNHRSYERRGSINPTVPYRRGSFWMEKKESLPSAAELNRIKRQIVCPQHQGTDRQAERMAA